MALNKSSGGIRPIAIGCTLRRLVAKCASLSVRQEMGAFLAPLQLGYGTPMGAEAAVHAARAYLHNLQPGQMILKVDFCNAFNCIRRDKMFQSVLSEVPGLYHLVQSVYADPSFLFFGPHIIESAEGVQQGDPLGPLLFSLSIHQLVRSLKSEFKLFYLDDGTMGGDLKDVVEDLYQIEQAAEDLGLVLNHRKCEVICVDEDTKQSMLSFSPHLQCVNPSEAYLLGSPIGSLEGIEAVLNSKKRSLELLGERLKLLHAHDALCLLRNAIALPKILYILRTAPCFSSSVLLDLDCLQRSLLEAICNVSLSDKSWSQASLPIRAGGLGIRKFAMLASSAFLASAAGSSLIAQRILPSSLTNAICPSKDDALVAWSQGHASEAPTGVDASKQRAWDTPHIEATVSSLFSSADDISKGRLLASQRQESGAWLSAPPVSSLGLRMDDETVRIAVGLRLGTRLCTPHQCVLCGDHVDSSGTHGLHCRRSAGRHPRHTHLNDLIKRSLASIDVPSILEPPGICRSDGKRVDGVSVTPWQSGRALAWDVTCCDIFAPTYTTLAATGAGLVANRAEDRKVRLYREVEATHVFIPVAIETSGTFGDEALAFFKEIGHRLRFKTQDPQSFFQLCQRISVCVQKFNCVSILGSSRV